MAKKVSGPKEYPRENGEREIPYGNAVHFQGRGGEWSVSEGDILIGWNVVPEWYRRNDLVTARLPPGKLFIYLHIFDDTHLFI